MPVKSKDSNKTWTIDASNQTWTLTEDAKITVKNVGHGIYEAGHDGNTIKVLGDIEASGMAYGVYLNGSNSAIQVGGESVIDASKGVSGIYSAAAGGEIENHGLVQGKLYGIQGAVWSNIENYGTIRGGYGIEHGGSGSQIYNHGKIDGKEHGISSEASGTYIENAKDGEITGALEAVMLSGTGEARIVNHGLLSSEGMAIMSLDSELAVKNTGKIIGDVYLGAGDDLFDSRKGTIKGSVEGGDGNDDYYVGAAKVKIVEQSGAGTGFDVVYANASHTLADNVEILNLLGKANIDGEGNSGQNWIFDNNGDNTLKGRGGSDHLEARQGDDILFGGGAQDYFLFTGKGVDTIKDFEDGLDLLSIGGVLSQSDFDALNIKQVKGDTVINLGDGDRIIIEDLLKSDFDYNDIATN